MPEPLGRRRFVGGSLAVTGAFLVGGCRDEPDGTLPPTTSDDGAPNAGDLDLLLALGQVEQTLADAFAALLDARADDLEAGGLAVRAGEHGDRHTAHVGALADTLAGTGVDPVTSAAPFPGMAVPGERDLAELSVSGLLGILARCEEGASATAADAVARLSLPDLRALAAGLGAADAGLAQALRLAVGGGIAALDPSDLVDGLLPLDRSYFAG